MGTTFFSNDAMRDIPVTTTKGLPVEIISGGGGGGGETFDGNVTIEGVAGGVAVPVTDNGGSLTVDGSVTVSNFPATQPVSGTVAVSNLPATQAVSGTLTAVTTVGTITNPVTVNTHAITGSGTFSVASASALQGAPPTLTSGTSALTQFRQPAIALTPTNVKAGSTRLHAYNVFNPNAYVVYFQIYNALTANVTVGTTTPFLTFGIAPGASWDGFWPNSYSFNVGVVVAATRNADGTGTALDTGVMVNLGYV